MKKLMMLIMVIGSAVFGANGTGFSFDNSNTADNVPVIAFPDVVTGLQSDDGSVCIVYLEIIDMGRPIPTVTPAQADIIQQLPDITTLALLGLGGLLYHRRKE